MSEIGFEVRKILQWLERTQYADSDLLIGRLLDSGKDEAEEIIGFDASSKEMFLSSGRRQRLLANSNIQIIDNTSGHILDRAIRNTRLPYEIAREQTWLQLNMWGLNGECLSDDMALRILDAIAHVQEGNLSGSDDRQVLYDAFRKVEAHRAGAIRKGAVLFEDIATAFGHVGVVPDDLYWRRACLWRDCREWQRSLEISAAYKDRGVVKTPDARAILATNRAATLMDMYVEGKSADSIRLSEAESCLKYAYGITPKAEELSKAWGRFHSLDRTHTGF